MSAHETPEISEICGYCHREFTDMDNVISIEEAGYCLNCDHMLGEVIEAQAGELKFL